jgi:hypothetical protein
MGVRSGMVGATSDEHSWTSRGPHQGVASWWRLVAPRRMTGVAALRPLRAAPSSPSLRSFYHCLLPSSRHTAARHEGIPASLRHCLTSPKHTPHSVRTASPPRRSTLGCASHARRIAGSETNSLVMMLPCATDVYPRIHRAYTAAIQAPRPSAAYRSRWQREPFHAAIDVFLRHGWVRWMVALPNIRLTPSQPHLIVPTNTLLALSTRR